ncbi:MAG: hypothetical protein SNJ62_08750, partial [Chloracidobacterium sp.]
PQVTGGHCSMRFGWYSLNRLSWRALANRPNPVTSALAQALELQLSRDSKDLGPGAHTRRPSKTCETMATDAPADAILL